MRKILLLSTYCSYTLSFQSNLLSRRIRINDGKKHFFLLSRSSTVTEDTTTTKDEIEKFPYCVEVTNNNNDKSWIKEAVNHLQENGVCVLLTKSGVGTSGLIDSENCLKTEFAATSRLSRLKNHIHEKGVNPDDDIFRYMEVVSRDKSGSRFDMPVPWKNYRDLGIPLTNEESTPIIKFHAKVEETIGPVIEELWKGSKPNIAASGFLINQPSSTDQLWHRDGPDEGFINVFIPLVDLSQELGPTAVISRTHLTDESTSDSNSIKIAPLMKKGQILLMDYRTFHKGLGNTSPNTTRTLAYTVFSKGSSSFGDMLSYGLLPQAYQSIDEVSVNIQCAHTLPFCAKLSSPTIAADLLKTHGVCVLVGEEEGSIIDSESSKTMSDIAISRLSDLLQRIENRGVDKDEPFQFVEIISRDEGGGRYEIPISWKSSENIGTPTSPVESTEIKLFHSMIDESLRPILQGFWDGEKYHVAKAGFLINEAGSSHYQWHRDSCEEGTISIFCPLNDMTEECGVTEIWPNSHVPVELSDGDLPKVAPLLKKGQLMLLDHRTLRQNLGNNDILRSSWTMAYFVVKKGVSLANSSSQKMLSGLTLEYD